MKNLLLVICVLTASFSFTQKSGTLKVKYTFEAIMDGYDHETKMELYVDGVLVQTSSVQKESLGNSMTYKLTRGKHKIKLMNYSLYEGNFELRSLANNYNTEGVIEKEIEIKKKNSIQITFNLDQPDPIILIK